jgi:hypothetical protein
MNSVLAHTWESSHEARDLGYRDIAEKNKRSRRWAIERGAMLEAHGWLEMEPTFFRGCWNGFNILRPRVPPNWIRAAMDTTQSEPCKMWAANESDAGQNGPSEMPAARDTSAAQNEPGATRAASPSAAMPLASTEAPPRFVRRYDPALPRRDNRRRFA